MMVVETEDETTLCEEADDCVQLDTNWISAE
jgi:hypothetical protein